METIYASGCVCYYFVGSHGDTQFQPEYDLYEYGGLNDVSEEINHH